MVADSLIIKNFSHYSSQLIVQSSRWILSSAIIITVFSVSACSSIVSSASNRLADNVTKGLISQDDLEIARLGTPAYLVLIDGFIENDPDNTAMLNAGAELYSTYAGAFIKDKIRSKRLTQKAFDYGHRSLCLLKKNTCDMHLQPHPDFVKILKTTELEHIAHLYSYSVSLLSWIQAHRDNLSAVAFLPKARSALEHIIELDETYKKGDVHLYLGVLHSLIPPSLGGKLEIAKAHFERAIELSNGFNLMAQVLYAEHYTRMLFNRDLHDRLLKNVVNADPHKPGYTLSNVLAQEQAKALLKDADDFF